MVVQVSRLMFLCFYTFKLFLDLLIPTQNAISGKMWNEAAKRAAVKQVPRPPPCSIKAVESTTAPSHGTFEQYTLLNRLSDTAKAQTKPSNDAMIVNEPAKPVAGSSKHPDDTDNIDGELIY